MVVVVVVVAVDLDSGVGFWARGLLVMPVLRLWT